MDRFIARQNIQHFKELLASETDPRQRAILERMIAEEEAKLAGKASAASGATVDDDVT